MTRLPIDPVDRAGYFTISHFGHDSIALDSSWCYQGMSNPLHPVISRYWESNPGHFHTREAHYHYVIPANKQARLTCFVTNLTRAVCFSS